MSASLFPPMLVVLVLGVGPAFGDCGLPAAPGGLPAFQGAAPRAPDPALRPARPACLAGLETPSAENCDREALATYGRAVEAWVSELNRYATQMNAYANAAARHANATIAAAQAARRAADAAFDFAECEVAGIRGPGG